ncbi:hypothetical protein [Mycolicibacterium sphagni]|uniref:Uncharacterized protein n=1 Tax=Mycolicibacterium sphagni TaxID=1786 RepID=A0ABX2K045_9MYCO|nr:hypothetical protein [Mycolicibacterium sphagni]NTY63383.1 hypothetical protein [Mycolicibacterium sphagni]
MRTGLWAIGRAWPTEDVAEAALLFPSALAGPALLPEVLAPAACAVSACASPVPLVRAAQTPTVIAPAPTQAAI